MSEEQNTSKPFRVLSVDGGGMRGLYTATFLDTLSQRIRKERGIKGPLDIGKGFDLIVGTSTGGIIATALAAGIPSSTIVDFYCSKGSSIFSNPLPTDGKKTKLLRWAISARSKPANDHTHLRLALDEVFGNRTLAELYEERHIALCVPAIDMTRHKCSVFKTPHHPKNEFNRDNETTLVEMCLATSAAPIVFPMALVKESTSDKAPKAHVDGGLCANNPTLIAFCEALLLRENDQPIEIVSLGTCPPPAGSDINNGRLNRGLFQWKAGISSLEVSMDAQAQLVTDTMNLFENRLGMPITFIRPNASTLTAEQYKHLGLDQASPKAIEVLMGAAKSDAHDICGSSAQTDYPKLKVLVDRFRSMPELQLP